MIDYVNSLKDILHWKKFVYSIKFFTCLIEKNNWCILWPTEPLNHFNIEFTDYINCVSWGINPKRNCELNTLACLIFELSISCQTPFAESKMLIHITSPLIIESRLFTPQHFIKLKVIAEDNLEYDLLKSVVVYTMKDCLLFQIINNIFYSTFPLISPSHFSFLILNNLRFKCFLISIVISPSVYMCSNVKSYASVTITPPRQTRRARTLVPPW